MKYFLILCLSLSLLANVVTQKVTKGSLSLSQSFTGNLSFNQKARLAAESSGLITKLSFDEADFVKKGSILLEIDSEILSANIKSTKASIKEVKFSLEKAKLDFKRYEVLLQKQSVSKQKYDEFYFQKMGLEQKLIALESTLLAQEIEKRKKILRAPFSGYISQREVQIGEWLSTGTQVALLVNPTKVDLTIHLPSAYITQVRKGLKIDVLINHKTYKAKVIGALLKGNQKTRTFPLRLRLLPTKDRFFDGMQATLRLQKSSSNDLLFVSRDGVVKRFGKDVLFIVKDKKAKMLSVKVLGFQGNKVAVEVKGLKVGDDVVIKGNERLMPNAEVH